MGQHFDTLRTGFGHMTSAMYQMHSANSRSEAEVTFTLSVVTTYSPTAPPQRTQSFHIKMGCPIFSVHQWRCTTCRTQLLFYLTHKTNSVSTIVLSGVWLCPTPGCIVPAYREKIFSAGLWCNLWEGMRLQSHDVCLLKLSIRSLLQVCSCSSKFLSAQQTMELR